MSETGRPFGSVSIGAEIAIAMGDDPRPYMTEEQIQEQLRVSKLTREEWDARIEELISASAAPF